MDASSPQDGCYGNGILKMRLAQSSVPEAPQIMTSSSNAPVRLGSAKKRISITFAATTFARERAPVFA
jgi:hypothetical protein